MSQSFLPYKPSPLDSKSIAAAIRTVRNVSALDRFTRVSVRETFNDVGGPNLYGVVREL